ncbi:BrnT family toxin [Rhizobium sp. G21]|uniref:BrnT family toxin n=1 Tax=Rhizobium sp. G21 TaxID=2758439 RepID=UPI001602F52B|nr:BrnT family toxin [Rhizobium sp. G21]MBB1250501.1 BrnT family toxin [Rhizobium sp. G21]
MIVEITEFTEFDWDEDKRVANIKKHGIDFEDAVFAMAERRHEYQLVRNGESRTVAICPQNNRLIAVVYVMRGKMIRIISVRLARANERRKYYESYN